MGSAHENEKAARYIAQLDEARCAGRWKDVPELCRKVEKHAPHRRCLTLTARSEAQISAYSTQRPSTAASSASSGLSQIIPSLLTAIEEEGDHVQDAFQATICLGWLHYVLEEPGLAIARLPKDFAAVASKLSSQGSSPSGWARVCIVKGAFLKGTSQDRTGSLGDAIQTYSAVLPWLSSLPTLGAESSLFLMWTERLLVRLCQLVNQSAETGQYADAEEALRIYRFWAKFWEITGNGTSAEGMSRPRRSAWKAYYDTLSAILRYNMPYSSEPRSLDNNTTSSQARQHSIIKLHQRAELKRVETVYESLLLKETHFPKASENNREIEAWTDAVMQNWRQLCGPTWSDEDLGEGGKEAVGRGVLDILYRAATKTFHSTQLLRHLFTVHAALAEFDLAFKAYDSYIEIVSRGKDRAEKSDEDLEIDDDSIVLRTSAEAIRLLCRFGSRKEAEKAVEIGARIENRLEQFPHIKSTTSEAGSVTSLETTVAPKALAIAYYAIGVSQAHWARFTYDADARAAIQTKAIRYLRKSLDPKFEDSKSIEAMYALSLILAEMRDIPGAIKVVKRALSPATKDKNSISADGVISGGVATNFGRERKLIPVWHLLGLLLTTRSEFAAAEKACEAAFEQFGDPAVLFGKDDENATYRSEHLNQANGTDAAARSVGVVDQMENFEKSGILQIKMTQLALVEVIDGSHAAVDGCDELLALYSRLFGDPAAAQAKLQPPAPAVVPPKSAVGTIRGSIFRGKGSVKAAKDLPNRNSSIASSRPSTVATQATGPPAIQVTDENGTDHAKEHHHSLLHHKNDGHHAGVTRSPSKLQKRSANSLRRRSESQPEPPSDLPDIPDGTTNGTLDRGHTAHTRSQRQPSISSSIRKSVESQERPLRSVAHNMHHSSGPPPIGHSTQPPQQDTRLPAPFPNTTYISPDPRFSKLQIRKHQVSLLSDIWIYISSLYTRAEMHEDARDAVDEARKLVDNFENDIAQESASSKVFADRGWGGGRSVEELWAHYFTARGDFLVAQSLKHEAKVDFERALLHYPDHPEAIVALSNLLLDVYCKIIPLEPTHDPEPRFPILPPTKPSALDTTPQQKKKHLASHTPSAENQLSPPELNRLAARDRAFGLLSTLTKLGAGWDYSEAWYALARAYEESGQVEKTKEVLWWCVELEDTHPVRSWKSVTLGGFVL
ncbi:hypothetical protein K491DRAFT_483969 [Lophiostoma macrostomum CBS 122681]|uniref:Filamentation protein-like protein n=1 Tax=Lophiostoma macrostomum CBS 122681 TaxID=1314788 RepID=A0A6A6T4X2_9PLEO|nr:hypothetical protein K491DRAFT_483969 [Lophiostoma macrostomum CBS 122681]